MFYYFGDERNWWTSWLVVAGSSAVTNNGNAIIITINGACVPVRSVSKSSQGHTRALELKYLSGERTWFMLLATPVSVSCYDMSKCLPRQYRSWFTSILRPCPHAWGSFYNKVTDITFLCGLAFCPQAKEIFRSLKTVILWNSFQGLCCFSFGLSL